MHLKYCYLIKINQITLRVQFEFIETVLTITMTWLFAVITNYYSIYL